MSKLLTVAEHLGGKLNTSTACAVSAAAAVKGDAIDVLVLANNADATATETAKIDGVSRALTVARPENVHAVLAPQTTRPDPAHAVAAFIRTALLLPLPAAAIEALTLDAALPTHTRLVELQQGKSDCPDLQSASKVVFDGRGVGSKENFDIIYTFADRIGADDAGYCPSEMQVGQTGKIIAPSGTWPLVSPARSSTSPASRTPAPS